MADMQDLLDAHNLQQNQQLQQQHHHQQVQHAQHYQQHPLLAKPQDDATAASGGIWEFVHTDILSGRGAFVNLNPGNKRFRALCFARKPEFDAANPAAKRRIAVEVVQKAVGTYGARFLKRDTNMSPWKEMDADAAQLKAQQVMRDYRRPDRVERDKKTRKRRKTALAAPVVDDLDDLVIAASLPTLPVEPIIEVLEGVHPHDVLLGRGAFVNSHPGNEYLRRKALERKELFEGGSFTEKRTLAAEIVRRIRELDPPGRFLRKVTPNESASANNISWEEVSDETAIHKANQAMRDIHRPDREYREQRKRQRQLEKEFKRTAPVEPATGVEKIANSAVLFHHAESPDDIFRNRLVAEALDSALGDVPIPRMDSV